VLVSQNDAIAGLFLYDAIQEADFERFSFKLDDAIDAIAIDCAKEGCITFAAEDHSFSVVSVDDVGETRAYKFVCANASGWSSWHSQLLPRDASQNAAVKDSVSPATASRQAAEQQRQEVQELQQQLARASETARTATQKLSGMEVAYKCAPFFAPPSPSSPALALICRLFPPPPVHRRSQPPFPAFSHQLAAFSKLKMRCFRSATVCCTKAFRPRTWSSPVSTTAWGKRLHAAHYAHVGGLCG
jgi:hypothetical protein